MNFFFKHSVMSSRKLYLLYFGNKKNFIIDINLNIHNLPQINVILTKQYINLLNLLFSLPFFDPPTVDII